MKALIICDSFAFAAKANTILQRAAHKADATFCWTIRPWKSDVLSLPPGADEALMEAIDAHLAVEDGWTLFSGSLSKSERLPISFQPHLLADLTVLTDDYFSVPDEQIKGIESVLTVAGGNVVYARDEFAPHGPPAIPVLPEWSPVKVFGGYGAPLDVRKAARAGVPMPAASTQRHVSRKRLQSRLASTHDWC